MKEIEVETLVVGSGIGGGTIAKTLVEGGHQVTLLERGDFLADIPENHSSKAIFCDGYFRPKETWYDIHGEPFSPGNYYYVGGNSKFYGAAMVRFRECDFEEISFKDGLSPAWPFRYEELETYYQKAEQLFCVHGDINQDSSEPFHSAPYPYPPVADELPIQEIRKRLCKNHVQVSSIPLSIFISDWLEHSKKPWDAFPNANYGKLDAETATIHPILNHPKFQLIRNAFVDQLETNADGDKIQSVIASVNGEPTRFHAKLVILAAGAINSALVLLRSKSEKFPQGLGNSSGVVGRYFMNHNTSALLSISPTFKNDAIYQKTIQINDFYEAKEEEGRGNIQLLGKIDANILKSNVPFIPSQILDYLAKHSVDWYVMGEDLPKAENRVFINDQNQICLHWKPNNLDTHFQLLKKTKRLMKQIGFPIQLSKSFDKKTPSHQCGTIRMGNDPQNAALDAYCKSYDHANLYVVDASFLPSSAALNPALTIAAQAIRVGEKILQNEN